MYAEKVDMVKLYSLLRTRKVLIVADNAVNPLPTATPDLRHVQSRRSKATDAKWSPVASWLALFIAAPTLN